MIERGAFGTGCRKTAAQKSRTWRKAGITGKSRAKICFAAHPQIAYVTSRNKSLL